MQIRYKGMFSEVQVPRFGLTFKSGEALTVAEDAARSLLEQEDNYEPVDAPAKAVLKDIVKAREERDEPDKPIFDAVAGVGGVQ